MSYHELLFFLFASFLFVSCSNGEGLSPVDVDLSQSGSYTVGYTTLALVDTTRSTPAHAGYPENPSRTVVTEVWYPAGAEERDAPADLSGAPYPLVVLSHGFSGTRTLSSFFTIHLASYGYIVAAPDFPLSRISTPGGPTAVDVINQPGDVSLIIDRLLEADPEAGNLFENLVDGERIGAVGHSLGGLTTLIVTFHPELSDPRIDASIFWAPLACIFDEDFYLNSEVPIFFMGGDADLLAEFNINIQEPYGRADAPKYFLGISGGTHMGFTDFPFADDLALGFMAAGLEGMGEEEEAWYDLLTGLGDMSLCGEFSLIADVPSNYSELVLDSDRQRELVNVYGTAFFELYLQDKEEYLYFFSPDFAETTPEVRVEYEE